MRARDVVGRRIVRVDHERFYDEHAGKTVTVVSRIVLDNGTILYPTASEGEYEPYGDIAVVTGAAIRRRRAS